MLYCQGALNTTAGATTHVLLRRPGRYRVQAVVDDRFSGRDAREVVDGRSADVPVYASVEAAVAASADGGQRPTHLVIGASYELGNFPSRARAEVIRALELGLHVVSGLFDNLALDPELGRLARGWDVTITDLRRRLGGFGPGLHRGRLPDVEARRVAVLGTDVGVGKLTTCLALADALRGIGRTVAVVGTSPTAWLSGVRDTVIVDNLIHRFAPVEIEHAVWMAWRQSRPQVLVVQGWGGLLSPAIPGGVEVMAAARPDCIVLQHAPGREYYQDADEYPIHSLDRQIEAAEQVSRRRVVALALSGEDLSPENAARARARIESETGLPAMDPLRDGVDDIIEAVLPYLQE